MTLAAALREARAANARLPPARIDVAANHATLREARGNLWPSVALGGDARYAHPESQPTGSEQVLQVTASGPLYDGGRLRAQIHVAAADLDASIARYRLTEADLEAEVRTRFAEELAAEHEVEIQREAVARVTRYVELIKLRHAGGQGLEADLLTAEAQLATQQAAQRDAELKRAQSRYSLNDLLGRDPVSPLELAPLPEPSPPPALLAPSPWLRVPDVRAAAADTRSAEAAIGVALAEHRPHLSFDVAAGYVGVPPASSPGESLGDRVLHGFGYSAMLTYTWTLFDFGGAYRARLAQARLARDHARAQQLVATRNARLSFDTARLQLDELATQLAMRVHATAVARDAYLANESMYRGGSGTGLAVIDAHRTWVDNALAESAVRLRYWTAEAQYLRWGGKTAL